MNNKSQVKKSPLGGCRGLLLAALIGFNACGDWLDVVPDGVATLDMAFKSRAQSLKYLGTCYSYMPKHGNPSLDPTILGGDEQWTGSHTYVNSLGLSFNGWYIAQGRQSATTPLLPGWNSMYQALRDCNTFLDNIDRVPDLPAWEREQWMAEIKVLKAYYHFYLVQMYGPVPLVRESVSVDDDLSKVIVKREPIDDCFRYIVELIDEAVEGEMLPPFIYDPNTDLGRITKSIALSLKAKVLVTAASPLYNGNDQQVTLRNHDGTQLFNQTKEPAKWQEALDACREAIEACHEANIELYVEPNPERYTDTIAKDLTLRNSFSTRWNIEVIWANTQSIAVGTSGGIIRLTTPILNPDWGASNGICRVYGPPLKIVSMFYTDKGVPLTEDHTRDISKIYNMRTAQEEDRLYIREGRTTVDLHFDREPRFYAWVGFDGGVWYGAGQYDDKSPISLRYLGFKIGEADGTKGVGNYTGYIPKKYVPFETQTTATNSVSAISYAWPIMRLSDLYLLCAEAINEVEGPNGPNSAELFGYIDKVRERAGLRGVKYSWATYSNNPTKYSTPSGMRQIIQQERMIELCFEGHRFWDVRRWKTALQLYNAAVQGWFTNVAVSDGTESEVNQIFYSPQFLFAQTFRDRDYFWPLRSSDLDINPNLIQNIGW